MTFEEFKKMTYHTRTRIRIPGSRQVINKEVFLKKKGKRVVLNMDKIDQILRSIYEEENYKDR